MLCQIELLAYARCKAGDFSNHQPDLTEFILPHDALYVLYIVDNIFSTPTDPDHCDGFFQSYSSVPGNLCIPV